MAENTHNNNRSSQRGKSSGWKSAGGRSGAGRDFERGEKRFSSRGKWQRNERNEFSRDGGHSGREARNGGRRWKAADDSRQDFNGRRNQNESWGKKRDSSGRRNQQWDSARDDRSGRNDREFRNEQDHRGRERKFTRRHETEQNRWQRSNREDRERFERTGGQHPSRQQKGSDPQRQRGHRGGERFGQDSRGVRDQRAELINEIPQSITPESLDPHTRAHLRNLNRENSEIVARHLAYAGEMLDLDPEVAYRHAKAAFNRAARVDVVREALGITAYVTGRYQEALSELRTYRRMSNDYTHVAMEADAERGMGRSEKALRFISEIPLARLNPEAKVELALVTSGARADLGDSEGGLAVINKILVQNLAPELAARVELVRADRLTELGREAQADALRAQWASIYQGDAEKEMMVLDLEEVFADEPEVAENSDSDALDAEFDHAAFAELFADVAETPDEIAADGDELGADNAANTDSDETESESANLQIALAAEAAEAELDLDDADIDWEAELASDAEFPEELS
ncbi:hypothetical protein [Arcanobacterium hippocoleae]|uniref:Helicase n=1 Tax=Arcanobacterium hippocoleae TaxID=149017 RepID=A0ABU1SZV7_9ACTO|nr:hypothetical protein [Arcanobacterium hippocoleae]MDR6938600.1 hypothetical protein [Arcanobacterium hippocoleae]